MSYTDIIQLPLDFIYAGFVVGIIWALLMMTTRIK